MKEDYDQVGIEGYEKETIKKIEAKVTEIFQDNVPLSDLQSGNFVLKALPEEVKKGRSKIIDDVISIQSQTPGDANLEVHEISELTLAPIETRVSLALIVEEEGTVVCSRTLTNFDREVIDAVATIAGTTQIMTAAMIYRVITGKGEGSPVNQSQKKRVEDSMKRCGHCDVTIDITSELRNIDAMSKGNDGLWYGGRVITYEEIRHQGNRGTTVYYKINSMPPFYTFAEKLGKISVFPLQLLDSPVSKTDNVIAIQSYLLREIDSMKRCCSPTVIEWKDIYQLAIQEGKMENKSENKRTRDTVCKILDFWISKYFIASYQSDLKKGIIQFDI